MEDFHGIATTWPVNLAYGRLRLAPLKNKYRMEWDALRQRNAQWLVTWDATEPVDRMAPLSYRGMVSAINRDARMGLAFPWGLFIEPEAGPEKVVSKKPSSRARLIGQLTASPVQWGSARQAAIGYWIDEGYAGQGLMPLAVAVASDYLIARVGLHRIEINILPRNRPSHRVVEKLGFRFEGIRERYLHINGVWEDHNSWALTAEEWPSEGLLGRINQQAQ